MDLFLRSSAVNLPTEGKPAENRSFNGTNMTMAVTEPCILCLVETPFYLVSLVFILTVWCLVVAAKDLTLVIRFVVANILVANFTAGLGVLVIILARIIVTRIRQLSLTDTPCRFLIAFVSVGGTSRPLIMAVFAVVVCIIIMKAISAVKFKFLTLGMLAMWLVCVVLSSTLFSSDVMQVFTLQNAACVPRSGNYSLVYTVPFFACFIFIPFALTVVILIATLRHIRANTVNENTADLRPMLKFAAFLLLGNLLSAIGQATPVIAAYVEAGSATAQVILAINHANGIMVLLSIIPTPILVLVYFKPVRTLMKRYLLRVFGNVCGIAMQKHLVNRMSPA